MKFTIALLVFWFLAFSPESFGQNRDPKFIKEQKKSQRKSQRNSRKSQKDFENNRNNKIRTNSGKNRSKQNSHAGKNETTNAYVEQKLVGNPNVSEREKENARTIHKNDKRTSRNARARSKNKVKKRKPPARNP